MWAERVTNLLVGKLLLKEKEGEKEGRENCIYPAGSRSVRLEK